MPRQIYLDNAATTSLREEVVLEMAKILREDFGNPSSTHSSGRHAKSILEMSRKNIAAQLGCSAQEILFTSGATEANNWILNSVLSTHKIERIITSKVEHHAVLHVVEHLASSRKIAVDYVPVLNDGCPDFAQLEILLKESKATTLVSLMHVNNEIGSLTDLNAIGDLCRQYVALFHSDTVQSIGKTKLDLSQLPIDFAVASAHKFHGPKGVGFAYVRKGLGLEPLFFGGEQEKGVRPGTESLHNIAGMAKALELSLSNLEDDRQYITGLKQYAIQKLTEVFPEIKINGSNSGFYNLLNICLPLEESLASMLLFHLDIQGIAVSRGSACQSGSNRPSHVLAEILGDSDLRKPSLRISFSHYNTKEEIDMLAEALFKLANK